MFVKLHVRLTSPFPVKSLNCCLYQLGLCWTNMFVNQLYIILMKGYCISSLFICFVIYIYWYYASLKLSFFEALVCTNINMVSSLSPRIIEYNDLAKKLNFEKKTRPAITITKKGRGDYRKQGQYGLITLSYVYTSKQNVISHKVSAISNMVFRVIWG